MSETSDSRLPEDPAAVAPFGLGPWRIEPALNRIAQGDEELSLEPRIMHVLVCLAARPGELITRRELLDAVWRDAVVGEETLTRAVSRLRILLGGADEDTRFLETIRGRGYRLLVAPAPVASGAGGASAAPPAPDAPAARRRVDRRALYALAVATVAATLLLTSGPWRRPVEPRDVLLVARPVTAYPGNEAYPAFTPDNSGVAFTWSGDARQPGGLFIKQLEREPPRRLTQPEGADSFPSISPDGTTVAFCRRSEAGYSLRTVSSLGGAERLLAETATRVVGIDWRPDGRRIAFAARLEAGAPFCVHELDLETLHVTPLTVVDETLYTGDSWPAYSPDGRQLAFARCDHAGLRDLWLVPATGGPARQVTRGLGRIDGLAWLPSSDGLIVSAEPEGRAGLYRIGLSDGRPRRLPVVAPGDALHPALSPDGGTLVFCNRTLDLDFVALELDRPDAEPKPFAVSTRNELGPAWSPDGRRIAFRSDRSGWPEIWLAEADGAGMRRLTDWRGPEISGLFWSPDGRRLAVNVDVGERSWIEIVDTETGLARELEAPDHQRCCGWVGDGRRLTVLRNDGPVWRLLRLDPDGDRAESGALALAGHPEVQDSATGLYSLDPASGALLWTPPGEETAREIFSADEMADWIARDISRAGLHILRAGPEGETRLEQVDPAARSMRLIRLVPGHPRALAVSPDGRRAILTTLESSQADLMSVPISPADGR